MSTSYPGSLKGQFLIAMPGLLDPNFSQTVTCVCEHTQQGAVGLVVNRAHASITCRDILDELGMKYTDDAPIAPIQIGGPVHTDQAFVLHGPPFGWEGCLMVTQTIALSSTPDIMEALASGRGPKSFIVAVGCAGWGPLQLESELKSNAWLTGPIDESIVFETNVEARWEEAVRRIGIDPGLLTNTAGNA